VAHHLKDLFQEALEVLPEVPSGRKYTLVNATVQAITGENTSHFFSPTFHWAYHMVYKPVS